MPTTIAIDLFSDVVCPWCFIGATRLEQALAGMASELTAQLRYRPFFLEPNLPRSGISVADKLRKAYGVEPKQLWSRAEAMARESGLALDLSRQPLMYPSDAAHTLLRHAHAKGTQPALAMALFHAYFQQAKNIADETVLADIAQEHGFNHAEARELASAQAELELTREEARAAAQGGIRGVPFFVFDGRLALSGAQSVSVLQATLRQALEPGASGQAPAPSH